MFRVLVLCIIAVGIGACVGCASTEPGQRADRAVHADYASTGLALLIRDGAREANPIWPLSILRYWMHRKVERWPCDRQTPLRVSEAVGWGAAANNLFIAAGAASAVAIPAGLVAAVIIYHRESGDCEPAQVISSPGDGMLHPQAVQPSPTDDGRRQ